MPRPEAPPTNETTRKVDISMTTNGFRDQADALVSRRPSGGFVGRTSLDEAPDVTRQVAQAVARAKEGDREAVRFLYLRYADNVYGYVRSIVRDDYEAEDVTQHVFAKLITAIGKYDQRGVPFFAWLLRLSRNAAVDYLRTRRATPSDEIFGADERVDENAAERAYSVHEALAALPDEQRKVVVLRHVVGLSPGEIADRIGRSESSVHGLHHRGRRALQAELTDRDVAPSTAAVKVAA
jgi:RNA polymerase sigma-70 factor, ECF subfamily